VKDVELNGDLGSTSCSSGLDDHPVSYSAQQKYSSSPPLLHLSADYCPPQVSFAECSNSFFRYVQMLPALLNQKPNQSTDTEESLWVSL